MLTIALVFAGLFVAASAAARGSRDLLWALIACVDPTRVRNGESCPKPRADDVDDRHPACRTTTQVWAQSEQYVAIRDLRMCGCPAGFVHGLAIPFARITGIEADHLPESLWQFAWDAAGTKIHDENSIALVVNPPALRSQDQLHIHLVRRGADACERFRKDSAVSVPSLSHVWETVKQRAREQHFTNYGVLVTKCSTHGYTVVVEDESAQRNRSLESQYTQHDCH